MHYTKFEGRLEDILAKYPNIDLVRYLEDNLQIPQYKATELARRIENTFHLETVYKIKQRREMTPLSEDQNSKGLSSRVNIYSLDSLSGKEFEHFLKWLFEELGYQVQPCKYVADSGVDLVATKEKEKIAIQAKRYQRSMKVGNA